MDFFVRHPTPRLLTVRIHPKGVDQGMRGRPGATIIVPGIGMQDKSELKEHLAMVNEKNRLSQCIDEARLEEAVEKRLSGRERPMSVQQLLEKGLRPGERRRVKS